MDINKEWTNGVELPGNTDISQDWVLTTYLEIKEEINYHIKHNHKINRQKLLHELAGYHKPMAMIIIDMLIERESELPEPKEG